jgi:hypothetical protein
MSPESETTEEIIKWFENPEHWNKNVMSFIGKNGLTMSTCLLGGLDHVNGKPGSVDRVQEIITSVIREQFPDRLDYPLDDCDSADVIVGFNDHPDTTITDVRAMLEKTLVQLQEEG